MTGSGPSSFLMGRLIFILVLFFLADVDGRAEKSTDSPPSFRYETRPVKETMSVTRHRHMTLNLGNGRIGVFAGFARETVELFDLKTETFRKLGCTQWFGDFHGITLSNGKALLVDGRNDCVFDIEKAEFAKAANLYSPQGARWTGMLALPDGRIFLCGGSDGNFKPLDNCAIFNPAKNRFETIGKLTIPRVGHTLSLIGQSKVLIAGGSTGDNGRESLDTLEIFNLETGSSSKLAVALKQARSRHVSIALSDYRILFAGGHDSRQSQWKLRSAEVFDLKTGTLKEVGPMALGRGEPGAAMLPSGRVAIFGGTQDLRAIEIYCPEQEEFIPADQIMIQARQSGFTVTPLDDGGILLVGGRVNQGREELNAAEIFTEKKDASYDNPRARVPELIRKLDDDIYRVREDASAELLRIGLPARGLLEAARKDPDPEVRVRVREILQRMGKAGLDEKWCVELWDHEKTEEVLWFGDYSCPDHPASAVEKDARLLKLKEFLANHKATRLVVRFTNFVPFHKQTEMLNLVGWTRFQRIERGKPL